MSKHLFFTTEQPVGRFYVTNINAEILIPISQSKTRDPYNSTGIQRVVNEGRVREISEYCKYPNAMFPTPIILSGKSKYFKFYNLSNEEYDEDSYKNLNNGYLEIEIENIKKDNQYLSIVDGQHRLLGIERSEEAQKFDLVVVFIFDTENYEDADIFSVINRNQKQVSKSLVYDLYGLTDDMTVEKFAHEIVQALNSSKKSKLQNKIKMLGYKTDDFQIITQGALVDQLIPLLSRKTTKDNLLLREGEILSSDSSLILREYLINDRMLEAQVQMIAFFNAWQNVIHGNNLDNTILTKTVGFIAGMKVFNTIYTKRSDTLININYREYKSYDYFDNEPLIINEISSSTKFYEQKLQKLNFKDIDPSHISSSLSGAKKIESILFS